MAQGLEALANLTEKELADLNRLATNGRNAGMTDRDFRELHDNNTPERLDERGGEVQVNERFAQTRSRRVDGLTFPQVTRGSRERQAVSNEPVRNDYPPTDRPIQRTTNPNVPNPEYDQSGGIVGVNHATNGNEINSRGGLSTDPRTAGMYVAPDFYHGGSYSPVFMGPNGELKPRFEGQVVYGPWRASLPEDFDPNARVYHDPLNFNQGHNYWKQNPDGTWVRRETGYGGIPLNDDGKPIFTPDPAKYPEYFVSSNDEPSTESATQTPGADRGRATSNVSGFYAPAARTSQMNTLLMSINNSPDPQATATGLAALADAINYSENPQATRAGLRAIAEAIENAPDAEAASAFWRALATAVMKI